jgi:disulfide bond formation protein DsbB
MKFLDPILKRWPIFALLAAAAALGIAHAFQTFGGLEPCHLCLKQREVYWAALPVAGLASISLFTQWKDAGRSFGGAALALIFLYGAYLAGFHAGAEWKWWPAPETCASGAKASLQGVMALMGGHAKAGPACDKAAWVFLGLSMAGWNFLLSLGLVAMSALSIFQPRTAR